MATEKKTGLILDNILDVLLNELDRLESERAVLIDKLNKIYRSRGEIIPASIRV
jgi:hypothetical protein